MPDIGSIFGHAEMTAIKNREGFSATFKKLKSEGKFARYELKRYIPITEKKDTKRRVLDDPPKKRSVSGTTRNGDPIVWR